MLVLRQIDRLAPVEAAGDGFTVRVKVLAGPAQPTPPLVNTGVALMVATTGEVPLLTAVNEAMLPVPEAASPMPAVLLIQLQVVVPPVFTVTKFTKAVANLLQSTWLPTALTCAEGFTVNTKVLDVPLQLQPPLVQVGVNTMVDVNGVAPVFSATIAVIFPVPEPASPMPGLLLI